MKGKHFQQNQQRKKTFLLSLFFSENKSEKYFCMGKLT